MSMKSNGSARPKALQKVCAIFPGALGDFICFLPALQALGRNASVDLFARSEFAEIAPPGVTVGSLERPEISALFRREPSADDHAQKFFGRYDGLYSWLGSADQEFIWRLRAVTDGRALVFPFRPVRSDTHQAAYYLKCVNAPSDFSGDSVIALGAEATRWCEEFWDRYDLQGRAILTIAPGSGSREKNWPPEYFLRVAKWWRETTAGVVILLIGPVEQERGGYDSLRERCVIASDLSLSQAAAMLSRSLVYLGNDSGISHLAAATGVRTLALFGPSDWRQWAPRGTRVTVLRRNLWCSPCQDPVMKSCPHHACLTELTPEEIISNLAQLPEVVTLTT
jgi:hypothetical protein